MADIPLFLGDDVLASLVQYTQTKHMTRFMLVADGNTFSALGHKVEKVLQDNGGDVKLVLFREHVVVPNEEFIFQALLQADDVERTYVAVGSGTLTDITRIVSHRTRCPFISVPTAPSVDGFTSSGASLVVRHNKRTISAQPPLAVFADLPTLAGAPQPMIAAGYGDILGKAIALADWQLGHLLWDEPYDSQVAARVRAALSSCIEGTDEIGRAAPEGIRKLMFSLIDSGFCMLEYGNSRPAAGCEHYMSHFLELKLLREGRPAVLHGAKVGLCAVLAAQLYAQIRQIDRHSAAVRLAAAPVPDRVANLRLIREAYGPIAEDLIAEQSPFLDLSDAGFRALKRRVLTNWEAILALAAEVPPPEKLADLLGKVGGETRPAALGLTEAELGQALAVSHYLRNRFTICKLAPILGLQVSL